MLRSIFPMPSPLLIGPEWVQTHSTLKVLSPYDGGLVGEVWLGDASHLERAVTAAQQAFATTRKQAAFERAEILDFEKMCAGKNMTRSARVRLTA